MVNKPEHKITPKNKGYPGKKIGEPPITHGSIQSKSSYTLKGKRNEGYEIGKPSQSVVANGMGFRSSLHNDITLDNKPHVFEKLLIGRNKIPPVCIFVSYKAPIDAEQKVKEKNIGSCEV
jgi:hypothetical protein